MVAGLRGKARHRRDDRADGRIGLDVAIPRADDGVGKLPQRSIGEDSGPRVDGHAEAMFRRKSRRIGVVRRHADVGACRIRAKEPRHAFLCTLRNLCRRLAREGETENLLRRNVTAKECPCVIKQVEDAQRQRLGLSGTRSCHHERRLKSSADDVALLRGEQSILRNLARDLRWRTPQTVDEAVVSGHESLTCAPSAWAGHARRTGQVLQC